MVHNETTKTATFENIEILQRNWVFLGNLEKEISIFS